MSCGFLYERRVAFADTDMAGVAHFTAILRWVEEAETAWLRAKGEALATRVSGAVLGWPKVSLQVDYRAPVRFDEVVTVELSDPEEGRRSRLWRFVIRTGAVTVAEGTMKVVRAAVAPDGTMTPVGPSA